MTKRNDSETVLLLTILQEPNAAKARKNYFRSFGLDEFDDRKIYDLFEDRVFDAIFRNEPCVEIERELAQALLLLLKNGVKKSRGGQRSDRHHDLRKRALVRLGRGLKAQHIKEGMSATQAEMQASEEAAEEGKQHGLDFSAGYLRREMQKADKPSR